MALTMSDERLSDLRDKMTRLHDWPSFGLATQRVFMDLLAELDATRALLAQAERERDRLLKTVVALPAEFYCACCGEVSADLPAMMSHLAVCPKHPLRAAEAALAASQASERELREALRSAMEMVRLWHGMGMDAASEQRAWKLYEEGAPEWQPLRDARDRAPGSTEALAAWGDRLVRAFAKQRMIEVADTEVADAVACVLDRSDTTDGGRS